jgi:hypothetical protein
MKPHMAKRVFIPRVSGSIQQYGLRYNKKNLIIYGSNQQNIIQSQRTDQKLFI